MRSRVIIIAAVVASLVAIALFANPAAADQNGGGGARDEYPWDTDNLKIGSTYTARSFAIPHYSFAGTDAGNARAGNIKIGEVRSPYANVWPCQSGVMDGFFQNQASQPRNDLPKLEKTAGVWGETSGHSCSSFRQAQDVAVSAAGVNGGYWLDSSGNLKQGGFGSWMSVARTAGDDVLSSQHVTWANKGGGYSVVRVNNNFQIQVVAPSATDEGYIARIDHGPSTSGGTDGRTVGAPAQGLSLPQTPVREGYIAPGETPKTYRGAYSATRHGSTASRHLPHAQSVGGGTGSLCPAGSHPRGEDSLYRIGSGTGRTLTSLSSDMKSRLADAFWCRSDIRYQIWYAPQIVTGTTCGTTGAPACPAGVSIPTEDFQAWGRVNCYYTALEIDSTGKCVYPHPVPSCADSDTGTARYFTATELATYTTDTVPFPAESDGSTTCAASATPAPTPGDPPALADFTADACVTADLEIAENRIAGSDAEPGVPESDRTLAVTAGRTAWDLDITSPHTRTASPPRGTGDASGCADGSEDRATHSSQPAGAARKQSPAPSSSDRTNTAAPPNDADDHIDYTGASRNIAHRYASNIAEHTCSVKLQEAEAELALLEAREAAFTQWLSDYKTAADSNAAAYGSYTKAATATSSGLSAIRFNDQETAKQTYADLLSAGYASLSSALTAAKTAYDTATDRTTGSTRAAVIRTSSNSGCVSHYDREITRLKTLFAGAETAALGAGASGISEEQNLIAQTRFVAPPAIAVSDSSVPYSQPSLLGVLSRTEPATECLDTGKPGNCWRAPAPGERCSGPWGACPGRTRTVIISYYTCPRRSYSVAGTISRAYKGTARSASYSTTYTSAGRSTESTSRTCPGWTSALTSGYSYAAYSGAVSYVMGTSGTASSLPSVAAVSQPAALQALGKSSLMGTYYGHVDRTDLRTSADADRRAAGLSLTVAVGTVPDGSPQKVTDYQTSYKTAYDTAYSQAEGHMSGTAWNSFDWRYEPSTLDWVGYQEDPATTYSASTATPRDGTGCDLITVASDGTISVEAASS